VESKETQTNWFD